MVTFNNNLIWYFLLYTYGFVIRDVHNEMIHHKKYF